MFGTIKNTRSPLWSWTDLKIFNIRTGKSSLLFYLEELLVGDWREYRDLIYESLLQLLNGRITLTLKNTGPREGSLENLFGMFDLKDVEAKITAALEKQPCTCETQELILDPAGRALRDRSITE